MDREQIKRIIDSSDTYDETKEESLYAWFRDAYSRKMRWVTGLIWAQYLILLIPTVYSAVAFFRTEEIASRILHATIFLFCNLWIGFVSVFGWVMLQRPHFSREIKRLELRIAELSEAIAQK